MNSFIINFAIYTLSMVGFISLALFIYKKAVSAPVNPQVKDFLKVENSLKLSPTKTVYVLKAGSEKFLIAGDASNTTMLSKLQDDNEDSALNMKISHINNVESPTMKKLAQRINRG